MDELIGTIKLFAGITCPKGYAFCHGQILQVSEYPALYSIIGNTYGGDDKQFALPDLRSRVPVGAGQGAGLSYYLLGSSTGSETTTLNRLNIPQLVGNVQLNGLTGTASGIIYGSATGNIAVPCATTATSSIAENNVISSESAGTGFEVYATAPDGSKTMQPFKASLPVTASASIPVTINNTNQQIVVNPSSSIYPIYNIQPVLGLNYIICIVGIYPTPND